MNNDDLLQKIKEAERTEQSESYFSAAILYKDALALAQKLKDSKSVKRCKAKVVEMNKKSIESGKDFQEHEFSHELSDEHQKQLKNFIIGFLKINDKSLVLKKIGIHPYFVPKIKDIEATSKKSTPIAYQFATLTTISSDGHALRGGSLGEYSWLMQMYDLTQKQIMSLYINKIMYMLIHNNPYGNKMSIIEISDYFIKSKLFDKSRLKITLTGLDSYFKEDYVSALHILVPQFESFLLDIASKLGINIVALDTSVDTATRTKTLSERDFDSAEFISIFGEDLCRQIKFVLFEPMGYKLRHKIAHGEISVEECNFQNVTLILYLYLVILARVTVKDSQTKPT